MTGSTRALEQAVYEESDHIIANTRGNGRIYQALGMDPGGFTVIPNGYDRAEAAAAMAEPVRKPSPPGVLDIGYMGFFDKDGFPWQDLLLAIRRLNAGKARA